MSGNKEQKDSSDEIEKKKKWLDERFERLRTNILGLSKSLEEGDSQKPIDESPEEQKKRAAERMQKLRNLTFNIYPFASVSVGGEDPNDEFHKIPAYIRRNMELDQNAPNAKNAVRMVLNGVEVDAVFDATDAYIPANYLSLYFPLNDYGEDEITEMISLLSDLYKSVGGDELEIKSIRTFEFVNQLTPELV